MTRFVAICLLCGCAVRSAADDSPKRGPADPQLRKELLHRMKIDQDARVKLMNWLGKQGLHGDMKIEQLSDEKRIEFKKLAEAANQADRDNTSWLRDVIESHGWPTRTMVGNDGASAAWLLVQHADADSKFQRKCLGLMSAQPKSEVSQTDLAYLTDRVLLAEGKKQIYGTQFTMVEGKPAPRPLEDEANVDKRRKAVGLPPLSAYLKSSEQFYSGTGK